MRMASAACVFALVACAAGASHSEPRSDGASAAASGAAHARAPAFALAAETVVGRWSFDRSCGLYDLVLSADAAVAYYDYADERHVVSYAGRWRIADHNRIAMSLHRLDASGAPTGAALAYGLTVADPVGEDLVGQFGPAGGSARVIAAKRCPEEDRE